MLKQLSGRIGVVPRMRMLILCALASAAVVGCCHKQEVPLARVAARWAMVTSNVSIGVLPKPTGADPLPTPATTQCVSDADLTSYFGATCGNHEATAAGSTSAGRDIGSG